MLSSRDQGRLETKFNGLVLVLGLVVVVLVLVLITIVLVLMHLGLVVSKFDYGKYLLLLAMVTNSGLNCQSDSTNRKPRSIQLHRRNCTARTVRWRHLVNVIKSSKDATQWNDSTRLGLFKTRVNTAEQPVAVLARNLGEGHGPIARAVARAYNRGLGAKPEAEVREAMYHCNARMVFLCNL